MSEEKEILVPEVPDSGRVLDQDINEWVSGWQNFFRVQKDVVFIESRSFTVDNTNVYSPAFNCSKYQRFSLAVKTLFAIASGIMEVMIQFSDNLVDWYEFYYDAYSDKDDTTGNISRPDPTYGGVVRNKIFINGNEQENYNIFSRLVLAKYIRIRVRSNSLAGGNSCIVSVKGFFSS